MKIYIIPKITELTDELISEVIDNYSIAFFTDDDGFTKVFLKFNHTKKNKAIFKKFKHYTRDEIQPKVDLLKQQNNVM